MPDAVGLEEQDALDRAQQRGQFVFGDVGTQPALIVAFGRPAVDPIRRTDKMLPQAEHPTEIRRAAAKAGIVLASDDGPRGKLARLRQSMRACESGQCGRGHWLAAIAPCTIV